MPDNLSRASLEKIGSTDATAPLILGNDVYEPLTFAPDIVRFSRKQYAFLHAFRLGTPLAEAASKAGMTPESVKRFLEKPDTITWLRDRALKDEIRNEWNEPGKWYAEGQKMLEQPDLAKHKLEIWKEFGDRAVPKPSRNASESQSSPKIVINIDPDAIERAKARKAAIDAQIVGETHEM
jgi:hypothetical protein